MRTSVSATNQPLIALLPLFALIASLTPTSARIIKVVNNCPSTVWPAIFTGGEYPKPPNHPTGWEMESLAFEQFEVADDWSAGRIWARTGCTIDEGGNFKCLTGACGPGEGGSMLCAPEKTGEPPATLAEFTMAPEGLDHYDISLVDGFNVPMNIYPTLEECVKPSCPTNINPLCPPLLRTSIDSEGKNLGCLAACNAGFGQETFGNRACCSGGYNNPELCAICGVDYYSVFKDNCASSYAYAYDEKTGNALHTCPTTAGRLADYVIEFCPNSTDYVGTLEADEKYIDATATCSNKVAMFSQTFPVNPSPTATKTAGSLQVIATALPGVDGHAALHIDVSDTVHGNYTGGGEGQGGSSQVHASGSYSTTLDHPGPTDRPTLSNTGGGGPSETDSKVTKVFTQVDGTTILEITQPTQEVIGGQCGLNGHRKGRKGGQWLKTRPLQQQKKKRRGMKYARRD